jgi:hypothetical protein
VPFIHEDVVVRRVDTDNWQTVCEIEYLGRDQRFKIPAGFVTDFASVPRIVTWLVPKYGIYTLAVILHDWLCELLKAGESPVSSRDADGILRRIMREQGVLFLQRWLMWTGVRWGALVQRHRRPGVWRDMPLVLVLSVLALPIVLPAAVGIGFGLALYRLLHLVTGG